MKNIDIKNLDWPGISLNLDKEGYALLPKLLNAEQIEILSAYLQSSQSHSDALSLEALKLGRGERRTWPGGLPDAFVDLPQILYEQLAPIASRWNEIMGLDAAYALDNVQYRDGVSSLKWRAAVTSHNLGAGDFQPLHQDDGSGGCFPIKLLILLSDPVVDFTGGEFVMVEQRPRMQSRPIVLPLRKGDAALICSAHRPFKGTKGFYRVNMKHAISRVNTGTRISVELQFAAT